MGLGVERKRGTKQYATLRPLTKAGVTDLGKGFQRMLGSLKKSEDRGRIQFRIVDRKPEHWVLDLYPGRSTVRRAEVRDPDFELVTRKETWDAIASGTLSPAEAFLHGKMRIRGDVQLGKRVFERLAAPGGDFEIC